MSKKAACRPGPSLVVGAIVLACMMHLPHDALAWGESLPEIRRAAEQIQSIQADFTQTKRLKILTRPLVSKGKLAYRRPQELRWEYASPIPSVLVASKDGIHRYLKRDGRFVEDSSAKLDSMKVVLSEINRWLAGDFEHSKAFHPVLHQGNPTRVELHPKDQTLARFVSKVVIALGKTPGTVESIDIFEGEDSSTHIEFTASRINEPLADSTFTVVP